MTKTHNDFALIAYIAFQSEGTGGLGKKALQKMVHLCSELFNVPVSYKFRLYTYGPFSRELASDMDVMDSLNILDVRFSAESNGYYISAGPSAESTIDSGDQFLSVYRTDIDALLDIFKGRLAKDLEISSMLSFIIKRNLVENTEDDSAVVEKFFEIKPHFEKRHVESRLAEIRQLVH